MSSKAPQPANHGFIMQGTDKLFFGHVAMYKVEAHQWQLVISGDLPSDIMEKYKAARAQNPSSFLFLTNQTPAILQDLLDAKEFDALIYIGFPNPACPTNPPPILSNFKLTNIQVLSEKSLLEQQLIPYPRKTMPFLVYGTRAQRHIQHVLTEYKNIQLMSDVAEIQGVNFPGEGPIYAHLNLPESAMQPFPPDIPPDFFFSPGKLFPSIIYSKDFQGKQIIGFGRIVIGKWVFVDSRVVNMIPGANEVSFFIPTSSIE